MSLFKWDERLSVGVSEFDAQHKELVGYVNKLNDAMMQGRGKNIVSEVLDELIKYTESHFRAEEIKMETYGYPEYARHKAEHTLLIEKVQAFKRDFEAYKTSLTLELMQFLRQWVMDHIMKTDKRYSAFFNEKGVR